MKIFAHRGASARRLENTLEAFELARALGADGVELDVQRCRSGEVVVFHDPDLTRLGGRALRVVDATWAELRACVLRGGHRIPLLEEVFEACGPELEVNVELKVEDARPTGLEAAVAAAVRRAGAGHRTFLSSFQPAALWRAWRVAPELPRALLFGSGQALPLRLGWHARAVPVGAVHPEHPLATPGRVARWHARGLTVRAWTVDDPVRVRALARAGVDAVIADAPDLARAALQAAPDATGRRPP